MKGKGNDKKGKIETDGKVEEQKKVDTCLHFVRISWLLKILKTFNPKECNKLIAGALTRRTEAQSVSMKFWVVLTNKHFGKIKTN